jgi:hypothetical protein
MPTEHLSHIASALQINVSGSGKLRSRNIRFRLHAAIRYLLDNVSSAAAMPISRSSAFATDFFSSFESHLWPVLSIAALHCITLPPKATANDVCSELTKHIISASCTQFSSTHPSHSGIEIELPDCAARLTCITKLYIANGRHE